MQRLWVCAALLAALMLRPTGANAQSGPFCGLDAPPPASNPPLLPIASPRAGYVLPSKGTIYALVVFIDFADEPNDIANPNWPRGADSTDMAGIGPNFMGKFIDLTPEQQSGLMANVTTFYRDQSLGQLTIVGHPLYKRARRTLEAYKSDQQTSGNVPYWSTRDVLQSLSAADVGDWGRYDSVATLGVYQQALRPDSVIDLVIVCYRDRYSTNPQPSQNNGWVGEGFPHLGGTTPNMDYTIAGGRLKVRAAKLGSGVTCQNGRLYPYVWPSLHEIAHYLLGETERYVDASGGLWSPLGSPTDNVSQCMGAYEREQLGWITLREAADGFTVDIPDFATTGIAYRLTGRNTDGTPFVGSLEYFFENHQRLPSPWIKFAEDGIYTYDVVDKLNMPSFGVPGQKGLYIVENIATSLRVVCADGRWKWTSTGTMPNPFNPTVTAQIFKHARADRDSGTTDRRLQHGNHNGAPYNQFVWVTRDEATGSPTWPATNGHQDGDAHDAWTPDVANVFSRFSNPLLARRGLSDARHRLGAGAGREQRRERAREVLVV